MPTAHLGTIGPNLSHSGASIVAMTIPHEIEIKLAASPAMFSGLHEHPALQGGDVQAQLVTTYFDTADSRLQQAGMALRIRENGALRELTVKCSTLPGGTRIQRGEWTVPSKGPHPDVGTLPARARALIDPVLGNLPLEPVAASIIERETREIRRCDAIIELAFDSGEIRAKSKTEPVCEVELELKSGTLAELLALAGELPLGPELRWSVATKAERCYALAYGQAPRPVHARPIRLSPDQDLVSGFQTIIWNSIEQLLANAPLVCGEGAPEAIHQARVAIRRLRAAIALFRKVVKDRQAPVLRAELRAAARQLGAVRDLDVLLERITAPGNTDDADTAELIAHLRSRRAAALVAAQELLASSQFQHLLIDTALWLEAGEWIAHARDKHADLALGAFAAKVLSRRRRKLRRKGRHLARIEDRARHRVRIETKKLRYGAMFFSSLFSTAPEHDRERFARSLARLQDRLGTLNDLATAEAQRAALFDGLDPITAARLSEKLELLSHDAGKLRGKLMKSAKKALGRVEETPAWWKAQQDAA